MTTGLERAADEVRSFVTRQGGSSSSPARKPYNVISGVAAKRQRRRQAEADERNESYEPRKKEAATVKTRGKKIKGLALRPLRTPPDRTSQKREINAARDRRALEPLSLSLQRHGTADAAAAARSREQV